MWSITNETPYLAERTAVIDRHGARHWVVVVKATFTLHPDGTTERSPLSLAPLLVPQYRGTPGKSSLLYEADMVSDKPGTDVLLNGAAYAPRGESATSVQVELRTDWFRKRLHVYGERVYERNILGRVSVSGPKPFLKMPIAYETAYGGYDDSDRDPQNHKMFAYNPVGTGVSRNGNSLIGRPAANTEFTEGPMRPDAAAGFGPLCSYWEPRRRYAGTYDVQWMRTRRPLLPLDYDEQWNMCAPADQQVKPHLRGGEWVELINLAPVGRLRISLPKIYFAFTTRFAAYRRLPSCEHRARLHTVLIEPDESRLVMVWHTKLSCGNDIDDIDDTTIREKTYV